MANQMTKTFAEEIEGAPEAFTFFLLAFDFLIGPSYSIVIVGDLKEKGTAEMLSEIRKHYLPTTTVMLKHPDQADLGYQQIDGKATAYICRDQTCLPPANSLSLMREQLGIK
jgi:uncharacterized protein YyaL (SSP411 family)